MIHHTNIATLDRYTDTNNQDPMNPSHPILTKIIQHTYNGHSLFRAFFRFSAPVVPLPVADLFTALVVPGAGPLPMLLLPMLIGGLAFPMTFASAVLSGDGDGCRSFPAATSFSEARLDVENFKGCSWSDIGETFRVIVGAVSVDGLLEVIVDLAVILVCVADAVVVVAAVVGGVEVDATELEAVEDGVSNSTGRVRGLAWILVINFALSQ